MYTLALVFAPFMLGLLFLYASTRAWYAKLVNRNGLSLVAVAYMTAIVLISSIASIALSVKMYREQKKTRVLFITQVNKVKISYTENGVLSFCGEDIHKSVYICVDRLEGKNGLTTSNGTSPVEFLEITPDPNWSLFSLDTYRVARVRNK
jgi:hypothetical protein